MTSNRPITTNPCDKIYKDFIHLGKGKYHCNSCNKLVIDISDQKEVNYDDYSGECIIATLDQVDEIRFIHPLRRFAVALFLAFGTSLFVIPEVNAQNHVEVPGVNDLIKIHGKVVGKKGYGIEDICIKLYNGGVFLQEVYTNEHGYFEMKYHADKGSVNLRIVVEGEDNGNDFTVERVFWGSNGDSYTIDDIKVPIKQIKQKRIRVGKIGGAKF